MFPDVLSDTRNILLNFLLGLLIAQRIWRGIRFHPRVQVILTFEVLQLAEDPTCSSRRDATGHEQLLTSPYVMSRGKRPQLPLD